jgi:hypothetical protein
MIVTVQHVSGALATVDLTNVTGWGQLLLEALADGAGFPAVTELWIRYDDGAEEYLEPGRASWRAIKLFEPGDVLVVKHHFNRRV